MSSNDRAPAPPQPIPEYELRVAGVLAPRWSAWFDGFTVAPGPNGTTVIRGAVVDQAALHGLLQKLRDAGIPLISLAQIPSQPASPEPASPNHKEN